MGRHVWQPTFRQGLWWWCIAFYGGLVLLLSLIMTHLLGAVLPSALATKVGYDSEGFFIALFLTAWIQFGLPALASSRRRWGWTVGLGVLFLIIGVVMLAVPMPGSVKTLNEGAFAVALLIPYTSVRRPLPSWAPWVSAVVVVFVAVVVTLQPASLVVNLAETLVALALAPVGFDLADRQILHPSRPSPRAWRAVWYLTIVFVPTLVVLLGTADRAGPGVVAHVLHYLGRGREGFVGIVLTMGFLSTVVAPSRPRLSPLAQPETTPTWSVVQPRLSVPATDGAQNRP